MERIEKWDRRFLELARCIASWSKDKSTQVGCVIVKDQAVLTTGYNGMCRGVSDDVAARLQRPEKYFWFEHAERNAVYNAAKIGVGLQGSVAYVTLCPCMDCGRALVQSGVSRVISPTLDKEKYSELWETHFPRTIELLKEANVRLDFID